jgi:hypothetical protein
MEYIELGITPYAEECAQVGADNYCDRVRAEGRAYINQLKRMIFQSKKIDELPFGIRLALKSFAHDFGLYYEVIVKYDESNGDAIDFAFEIENNLPANWDDEAKKELKEQGYDLVY